MPSQALDRQRELTANTALRDLPRPQASTARAVLIHPDAAAQLRPAPANLIRALWIAAATHTPLSGALSRDGATGARVVLPDSHPAFHLMALAGPHAVIRRADITRRTAHTERLFNPGHAGRAVLAPDHPLHPLRDPHVTALQAARTWPDAQLAAQTEADAAYDPDAPRESISADALSATLGARTTAWMRGVLQHLTSPGTLLTRHGPVRMISGALHHADRTVDEAHAALLLRPRSNVTLNRATSPGTAAQATHALGLLIPDDWHVLLSGPDDTPTHLTTWPPGQRHALHVRLPSCARPDAHRPLLKFYAASVIPSPAGFHPARRKSAGDMADAIRAARARRPA